MFDIFRSRYVIHATLTVDSGLHVGGGRMSPVAGSDNPVMKDFDGRPFIPGSSIKGVLRSSLEALIRAMQDKNALWSCDLVSGKACVEQREEYIETLYPMSTHRKQDLLQEDGYEQHVFDHSCHVCRLFGSPFFASKVFIKDSQLLYNESGEPIAFSRIELRDFVAIDRDTGTARHQGKFDAEVVPTGTQFGLEMIIENPEEYELGLILLGFDLFNEGHLRLGGLASRGLGRIRINMETIERSTLEAVLGSGPESIDITTLRVNAMSALRQRFAPVKTEEETPHA